MLMIQKTRASQLFKAVPPLHHLGGGGLGGKERDKFYSEYYSSSSSRITPTLLASRLKNFRHLSVL
jgi:hypothetical protein